MKNKIRSPVLLLAALALVVGLGAIAAFAEDIDPWNDQSQYAWGENVGWLNAEPGGSGGPGVMVFDSHLEGYMWGKNIGWISLHCSNTGTCGDVGYSVENDGAGNLSGWAWGENVGWISFACENTRTCGDVDYGVTIDPVTGVFSGYAWGENIGWISFSDDVPVAYQVQTSWACAGAAIDNGPDVPGDDTTVANSPGVAACVHDGDLDNDGLADVDEEPLNNCGAFNGTPSGHPSPAGGDITNHDDHDGNPAPPMGTDTDGSDNGPSWDADNDSAPDGAECIAGHNPRDPGDRPVHATECAGLDDDDDGLPNAWEFCKWGTDELNDDTDGDLKGDCIEAADVNGDGIADFVGDTIYYAKAALLAGFGKTMDFDINGDGIVDFVGDTIQEAKFALIAGLCK